MIRAGVIVQRERKRKQRALPIRPIRSRHFPAMPGNNRVADIQSQPNALRQPCGLFRSVKFIEQVRNVARLKPFTFVGDRDPNEPAVDRPTDLDRPFRRILHRVRQQVRQNLLDPVRVGIDAGGTGQGNSS